MKIKTANEFITECKKEYLAKTDEYINKRIKAIQEWMSETFGNVEYEIITISNSCR